MPNRMQVTQSHNVLAIFKALFQLRLLEARMSNFTHDRFEAYRKELICICVVKYLILHNAIQRISCPRRHGGQTEWRARRQSSYLNNSISTCLSGHPKYDLLEVEICEKKANFLLCHKLPRKLLITIAARRLSNESEEMGARQQTELFFYLGNHWGITYDI